MAPLAIPPGDEDAGDLTEEFEHVHGNRRHLDPVSLSHYQGQSAASERGNSPRPRRRTSPPTATPAAHTPRTPSARRTLSPGKPLSPSRWAPRGSYPSQAHYTASPWRFSRLFREDVSPGSGPLSGRIGVVDQDAPSPSMTVQVPSAHSSTLAMRVSSAQMHSKSVASHLESSRPSVRQSVCGNTSSVRLPRCPFKWHLPLRFQDLPRIWASPAPGRSPQGPPC